MWCVVVFFFFFPTGQGDRKTDLLSTVLETRHRCFACGPRSPLPDSVASLPLRGCHGSPAGGSEANSAVGLFGCLSLGGVRLGLPLFFCAV